MGQFPWGRLLATTVLFGSWVGTPALAVEETTVNGRLDNSSDVLEDKSYYNVHTFEGTAGEQIVIDLISSEFDSLLILFDPEGNAISGDDDGGEGTNAKIVVTLPTTGTYQILANSYGEQQVGSYTLSWREATASEVLQAEAERLFQQGRRQYEVSQFREALESLQQALPLFRQLSDRAGEAATLTGIGGVYSNIGEPQQALEYYNPALLIFREVGKRAGEATTLNNMGVVYYDIGQPQQALEYYNQSLPIRREVGDRAGEAATLTNMGTVYYNIGQPQQALEYYNQALPILREVGDRATEAFTLNGIGAVYRSIEQPQQALDYFNQALPIFREVGDRAGEASTLNDIGAVYHNIGQPQQALEYLNQALPISREVGDRATEAFTLNGIGEVYRSIGQLQQALNYFNQALPIARDVGAREGEATILNNIGAVYYNIGQPQQALEYYDQALPILREVGIRATEARTLNNIGVVYTKIGEPQQALDFYNQALPILRKVGDHAGEAATLNNIGAVYTKIGEPQQALEYYNPALPIRREVGDRAGEAATLTNMGTVYYNIGEPQQALEYYNPALLISREVEDRATEAITLSNIGFVYENQGKITQAIDFYQQSIERRESIQSDIKIEELKTSFASQQFDTYERLINLLWNQGDDEAAFNYVERSKARAFLDQFANGRIDIRAGADSQLLEQEQNLNFQLTALRQQLFELKNQPQNQWDDEAIKDITKQVTSLENKYETLLTQLKLQSPETASLVSVDAATLSEIQSLLDEDTTLIEYFFTQELTLAFIITRNRFQVFPLKVTAEQIAEELESFHDFARLTNPHPAELQQLHQWLIASLQPHLNTLKLTIVPHGTLHYLPFAALTDSQTYLSDTFILSQLPSASTLRYLADKRKENTNDSILALGNPAIAEPLAPLDYAQQEAETIARLFNTNALIGKTATESAVLEQSNQTEILHIAAHGEYNRFNPLFSTLHLASDAQNDGRLEVHEVYQLDLTVKTNLVVLSACQTQIGSYNNEEAALSRGDEVVALSRAFLYAGTPTIIASLWNVDDEATGLLMERFYTHLKAGMSKREALQQSQKEVRSQYPHPYHWAAFSLIGD